MPSDPTRKAAVQQQAGMQAHDSLAHAPQNNIRGALRDLDKYPEEHLDLGNRINGITSGMQSSRTTRLVLSQLLQPNTHI